MILVAFLIILVILLIYYDSLFVPRLRKDHPLGKVIKIIIRL